MRKLQIPKWIAEKYNRDTNQGDKPACKACGRKIGLGILCFRVDYTSLFKNRNFKRDEFSLKMAPFRICLQMKCFNDFSAKLLPNQKFREESNVPRIERVDLANIFDNDKIIVRNLYKNTQVIFDNNI